ncbi:4'-phosphopantetheinyl transferase [Punctularia strigosozonata HHB-11173 SS5]|uniref:4'-phosphopantetheinyl transferase n=1 Tax=Punctularia strigosozonata (strain HHB-11173) TaxID=741275 RepID=UPI0004416FA6|nr:4'-phosphopantetheinyl transferase [Punctularia strigosozonata HHB-11173 SS5]EIN10680.1 4'-phosphopantetheinyl transferase [Punctularia strigosozonata HHB-11173 SS5]
MHIWVVSYDPTSVSDDLYQQALVLVDEVSQARIKRFYRREDACRCLIGRLLPRMMLKSRGLYTDDVTFSATETGKPYIVAPGITPPIAFNISHDNGIVAMAYGEGDRSHAPEYRIGIDVMKVELPRRTVLKDFIESVSDQLTQAERHLLRSPDGGLALRYFFNIWTMKEAYTKALGLGLGFDFRRLDYDVPNGVLKVDGKDPDGWEFMTFDLPSETGVAALHVGVVARFHGKEGSVMRHVGTDTDILQRFEAASFLKNALLELGRD